METPFFTVSGIYHFRDTRTRFSRTLRAESAEAVRQECDRRAMELGADDVDVHLIEKLEAN